MKSEYIRNVFKNHIPFILLISSFLVVLPNVMKGIDVTDTCYLLSKYKYIFDHGVEVNSFSTLFTELLGGCIYHLLPQYQVLALNLCNWLLNVLTSIIIYTLLKNRINRYILATAIIGGTFFSIALIHIFHYNTISMFLQILGLLIMMRALEKEKSNLYFICGLIFGLNIFFRLPNILQLGLAAVIVWYGIIRKIHYKLIINRVFIFALGIILGVCCGLISGIFVLGWDSIYKNIRWIFSLATSDSDAHSINTMGTSFIIGIKNGFYHLYNKGRLLVVLLIVLCFIYYALGRINKAINKRVYIIGIMASAMYAYVLSKSYYFLSITEMLVVLFLCICILGAIFFRKSDPILSSLCAANIIIELIITIGTSNGSYAYLYCFSIPISISLCVLMKAISIIKKKNEIYKLLYILPSFIVIITLLIGSNYISTNVYRDSAYEELNKEVDIDEFKGIKTTIERAALLEKLMELLQPYNDKTLLALGDFNIGYVITDMKPFFSKAWPDLASFGIEDFEYELESKISGGIYPVILLADIEGDGLYRDMEKYELVFKMAQSDKYSMYYSDEYYSIFIPY